MTLGAVEMNGKKWDVLMMCCDKHKPYKTYTTSRPLNVNIIFDGFCGWFGVLAPSQHLWLHRNPQERVQQMEFW